MPLTDFAMFIPSVAPVSTVQSDWLYRAAHPQLQKWQCGSKKQDEVSQTSGG